MKLIIGIAIGVFVFNVIAGILKALFGSKKRDDGYVELNPIDHGFKGRVMLGEEVLDDGTPLEVLNFDIKGVIVGAKNFWRGVARVVTLDVTESSDDPYPVLCAIDGLQREDSCIFEFTSAPQEFGELAFIESWMTMFQVPVEALQFARRGRRKLVICFGIVEIDTDEVQVYDEVTFEYDVKEPGYIDLDNIQQEMDKLTVQLAVLVSASDGVMDKTEGEVVQHWIKKRLSVETDAERAERIKNELNQAILQAGTKMGQPVDVPTICNRIVSEGVHAHRYDALELCLEVVGADGVAEDAEMAVIEQIAQHLEVDAARFKEMVEKALPVTMMANKDPDSVLGINPDMSKDEVRKLLSQQFRKWNSRVSHSDKAVREQATEMLGLIEDARKRHIG